MSLGFSRRSLLRSLGVGIPAVALPVLRSSPLMAAPPPVRLVVLFKANGTIIDAWKPQGSGTSWTIPANGILTPLAKHKAKLNVLGGVNYDSGDKFVNAAAHQKGPVACLTGGGALTGAFRGGNGNSSGYGNNISVDQYIAAKWGPVTRLKTLELGVAIGNANNRNRISYLGSNQPVPPEPNAAKAFAQVFGSYVPSGAATGGGGDPQVLRLLAERKSVLDYVSKDLRRLAGRLPGDERMRLDRHLQSVTELERQLMPSVGGGAACAPQAPANPADYPKNSQVMLDLIHMTLACDQTRLVTFLWNGETSQQTFPWLGVNDAHHDMSHKPDGDGATRTKLITVNTWYASQVAYLLDKMDAVNEGPDNRTMLDNSLVIWTDGLGKGNNHSRKNIPWVLAGKAGGYLPTGRYLDYGSKPHNHLLVNVLHAMGLRDESFFGHPSLSAWSGPLPGLAPG